MSYQKYFKPEGATDSKVESGVLSVNYFYATSGLKKFKGGGRIANGNSVGEGQCCRPLETREHIGRGKPGGWPLTLSASECQVR